MAKKKPNYDDYLKKYCNYKDDVDEYKKHREYFDSYVKCCNENKLIPVSITKFKNHLKKTIDKTKAQKFMNMMHQGKTLGECKEHFELTFDEVNIIMNASVVKNSYFGREVKL